jgi:RimJ/RimL family protein N-acetyltransferase
MRVMTTLTTDRLLLRTWTIDDYEPFAAMFAEQEVMRFLSSDGQPQSRFASWQNFAAQVGHWKLRGFGLFAVVERGSGEFVGRVGPWFPEGWPDVEIGWTLRSRFWGRGYATEAARAVLPYVFDDLGKNRVISLIPPDNLASIRVAFKLGEVLEGTTTVAHTPPGKYLLQYGLSKSDWLRSLASR